MGKTLGKILKVGAVVAGIALAIPSGGTSLLAVGLGVSATAASAIALGLAIGSSLLAVRPKAPKTSDAAADRLTVSIDPRTPRKIVFGHTAMGTDLRDQEYTGNQEYLHRFIVVASHRVQSIDEIWFDDKKAWSSAGGITSEFAGYLSVTPVLEGSAANAINISSRMGASRRYTGCAYVYFRYKLTGNSKKTSSPFAQSVPSRLTIIGDAALIYDPRLDDTQGGSGAQRADDQTTWAWDDDAARNPALQLLWYLLGWRIKNPVTGTWKLAVGKGLPPERIDIASFITAANLCDETVSKADGGTEPRYRSDGIFSEGDELSTVLDNLKAAMNAVLDDVDGKLRLTVLHNDLAAPIGDLVTDDVLGEFTWNQTAALNDTVNVIRGGYTDPSTTSLYQLLDYPEVRIDSADDIDRIQQVDLPMVQSPSQAQRLIKLRLQRVLYAGTFKATFQATGWKFQKGDVIRFTFAPLGFDAKLFRIADITVQVDGTVPMILREENADLYLWDASDAPAVQGVAPTTYNPLTSPTNLAIDDAATSANWSNIADDDGNKPDDNATAGAPPGTSVGDRPVEDLLNDLDGAMSDISTLNGAVGTAQGDIAQARSDLTDEVDRAKGAEDAINATIAALDQTVAGNAAAISDEATTRSTAISALSNRTATLEAASGGVSITPNSRFADWPSGNDHPTGWVHATGPAFTKAAGEGGIGNGWVIPGSAGADSYAYGAGSPSGAIATGGWYVVEGDFRLDAGTLSGAGILFRARKADGSTLQDLRVNFYSDPANNTNAAIGNGVVGQTYRFRKMVQVTASGADSAIVFAMSHFSAFGQSIAAANQLTWYRCGVRPATPEEIKTGQIDDLAASVATNAGAIVDLQNGKANASTVTALQATVGDQAAEISAVQAVAADAKGTANAIVGVKLDVNGKISGTASENNGETSAFVVLSDVFEVSGGTGLRTEYSNGSWKVYYANGQIALEFGIYS